MTLPRSTQRIVDYAGERGVDVDVAEFAEGTKTAADAAAAVGCSVAAIVKSLVFMVDEEPVLALIPGDLRLDEKKLAGEAGGARARRASLEEVRGATGYAAGGTPPFAHERPIRVLADRKLSRNDPLWVAGGTPSSLFQIALDDLIRLSAATWADVSR
ncbi:MAG TPA: YbaK/EbsC family protein [Acidimicrobiia bacterium]|nr:YbaK/EbsC family protein [Acidimicrobiia bacterium]